MLGAQRVRGLAIWGLAGLLAIPIVLALAPPALAQTGITTKDEIVLSGEVMVDKGETVRNVVIFNGPVTVDGTVSGSVVSFNGAVTISGTVDGDVTSFNGTVTLASGARVGGNLVTQTEPFIAPGATVVGSTQRTNARVFLGRFEWISTFAVWIAVSVSTLGFGLLLLGFAPRAAESVAAAAIERVGPSVGWGAALFFGLPILSVIALVTIVGIPFGIGMLLGLALIYTLGYAASSLALGRVLVKRPTSPFLAYLAGWGILRVVALAPILSGFVWFAATAYGLGMLAVAARAVQRKPAAAMVTSPLPPPPPMPSPSA